jgi:hypothetical protein
MADITINKFTTQVVRTGSTPSSAGFAANEGQNPVEPSGSEQNHLPVSIAAVSDGLTITDSQILSGAGTTAQYIRGDGSLATFPSLTGYVPYTGATQNVDLGEFGVDAGFVNLDTTPTNTPTTQGTIYWDDARSTAALIMNGTIQHIGQDTFFYVKNSTGSSIPKGTAVRFAGTDGASGHLLITPFLANGSVPSTYFMGVTAETIGNGQFGQVMHFGELEGINTSGYTAGSLLYASTTVAGGYQTTVPVAPNNIVLIAATINSKNNGAILVRPTYGSNINTDEGVKITSPATGQLLQLQAGGLWENKTKAQILGGTSSQFVKGDSSLDSTTYQSTADKGQPNGYAGLDSNGKVPLAQINDALIGNVNFQGLWNAATNTPTLANPPAAGTKGYYYIVSTAGTFAGISFEVGDWIISSGSAWQKIDNTDAVSSVFGRTGNVTAANGDYNTSQVTENTNLYYTEARVNANTNVAANTAARHAAVTLGTANGLSLSTQQLSLGLASAGVTGALSGTDWSTFNSKQNALTNPVTGTGTSGQIAYFNGTTTITSESGLTWDDASNRLTIGLISTNIPLVVSSGDVNSTVAFLTGNNAARGLTIGTYNSGVDDSGVNINALHSSGQISLSTAGNQRVIVSNGSVDLRNTTLAASSVYFDTTYQDALTVNSLGRVLINKTDDNGARLQVSGTSTFSDNISVNNLLTIAYADISAGNNRGLRIVNTDPTEGTAYNITAGRTGQNNGDFVIRNTTTGVNNLFFNRTTGAATFSSSVSLNTDSNNFLQLARASGNFAFQIFRDASLGVDILRAKLSDNSTWHNYITMGEGNSSHASSPIVMQEQGGNVGIGTTSPTVASGLGLVLNGQAGQTRLAFKNNYTGDSSGDGVQFALIGGSSAFVFQNRESDGYFSFETNGNEVYRTSGTNLLVGTTTDNGARLQVSGNLDVFANSSGGYVVARVNNTNSGGYSRLLLDVNSGISGSADVSYAPGIFFAMGPSGNDTSTPIVFRNNNATERMRITSGGNVLIGTTTDNGFKLGVSGTAQISGTPPSTNGGLLNIRDSVTALDVTSFAGVFFNSSPGNDYSIGKLTENSSGFLQIRNANSGTELLRINSTGAATFSSSIATGAPAGGTTNSWKLGTVATVSPTSPNRTIEVEVGGTTYYLHAKTTNN